MTASSLEAVKIYPGEATTAPEILGIADEYRKAAHLLISANLLRTPVSRAPCRFLAIHAIEMYLNALLLHWGMEPSKIRGMQHDVSARAKLTLQNGLMLRRRTADHLAGMTEGREYLLARYMPKMIPTAAQLNRLMATQDELAEKAAVIIPAR